ncbi:MAG: response regulator [Lachnospiraceae bacterium]|jgi:two-component system response regulator YesN|nr:response regulator [Lachnospiraceae bacterium]MEE3461439.1 response regulator [Lachnospiraceae bacterium]
MNILIVDDEVIERNGIKMLLKREKVDAKVREAPNGVKALEMLEEEPADLLLTDIRMPHMDGIELTGICSEKYPNLKMVIFSGYGEFEYARKAMKSGVVNYILKPVDPTEFHKTITEVISQMNEEAAASQAREKTEGFVKEHVLLSLINGVDPSSIDSQLLGLLPDGLLESFTAMALISFDHDVFGSKAANFSKDIEKRIGVDFLYLNLDPVSSVLLFFEPVEDPKALGQKILNEINVLYDERGYIAVSNDLPGGSANKCALSKTYDILEELMENQFYMLDDRVFLAGEDTREEPADLHDIDSDQLLNQIRQDIHLKDMVGLREHYEKLCEKYKRNTGFSQIYVKFVFSNLMKEISDTLPNDNRGSLSADVDRLYKTNDFSEIMNILDRGISLLEENFSINPQTAHREIETVKQYIYEHYGDELSTDILADQVFLAPSYLSHIFKKETGQNLSKFIKSLRMEKAKQMLENSHNKIVNISTAVGYPNVSYFCKSFREYFGVSPQKYREEKGL